MINVRNKGASGERELAFLLETWALEAGVTVALERNLEQTRGGGFDLVGIPTLAIEVKRVQSLAVDAWWAQTTRQAKPGNLIPFLAYRPNRKPWRFKIRVEVTHGEFTHTVDTDMDMKDGKKWFMYHVFSNKSLYSVKK